MGQTTDEEYRTVGILDEISETISAMTVKLQPVLLCDPRVSDDEAVEKAKSQVRERLSSILTELNILNSRIEL